MKEYQITLSPTEFEALKQATKRTLIETYKTESYDKQLEEAFYKICFATKL